jgi:outer membrane protein assembly factor BamB/predicted phosphodiesterase
MHQKPQVLRWMLTFCYLFILFCSGFAWQFIQMTDTHIGDQAGNAKFQEVIPAFNALLPKPDFIINTGDLTEAGTETQFSLYTTLIHQINIPVYSVLGNHEVRWTDICKERFVHYFGNRYYSFDHNGIHFVILDGTIPLQHHGHFYRTQLAWLKKDLKHLKKKTPVIITLHHPPASGDRVIDNAPALFEVIHSYNVVAILVGHGHINQLNYYENIPILMTKATRSGGYKIYDVGTKEITAYAYEIGKTIASDTIRISFNREKMEEGRGKQKPKDEKSSFFLAKRSSFVSRISDGLQFPPAIGEGKLFYGTEPGQLYALDAKSGKQVWKKKVTGAIIGSPAYAEDNIYIAATDGGIYSFRAKDGKPNCKFQTGGAIIASPRVKDNILYVGSGDHNFYAIDCKTGKEKWEFRCGNFVSSRALVHQGKVYFGSWDGNAYCLDAYTGATVWVNPVGKSIYWAPSVTDPVLVDTTVIFTALEMIEKKVMSRTYAFDCFTGATVWTAIIKICQTTPGVYSNNLYFVSLGGEVNALNAGDGSQVWATELNQAVYANEFFANGEKIFIPLLNGELALLNRTDGKEIQRVPISSTGFLFSGPVVYNGICYQSAFDGTVVAFPIN